MAELFSDAGYATAALGKWHLGEVPGRLPTDKGFDEWFGIKNSSDEAGYSSYRLFRELGYPRPQMWEGVKGQPVKPVGVFPPLRDAPDRAAADGGARSDHRGIGRVADQWRIVWRLRRVRSAEVALALVAFGGVLVFGVVGGVVVAIALSIGVFLYRAARPHDAVLGWVEDVDGYHDIARWGGAETLPGLLVYRFDAPPFFVNATHLRQRVLTLADASENLKWLVLNAEAWTYLDSTAIDVLARLQVELEQRGITLCFARLKGRQREIFEATGLTARVGRDRFFPTVRAAVAAFESDGG